MTDNGAALLKYESEDCPGLASWSAANAQRSWTAADGTKWVSNQIFQFTLNIEHPQVLICVQKAIVAAGGPANAPECPFTPAITPP